MRTPRVHAPAAAPGRLVELDADEAHHLVRVLRRGIGDAVELVGADRGVYRGTIADVGDEGGSPRVRVQVVDVARHGPRVLPWTVAVAPVKGSGLDLAVRLGSELGLARIVLLACERGQVPARASGRRERWERVARESAKQCGRPVPLEIGEAGGIEDVVAAAAGARAWIAAPGEDRGGLRDLLTRAGSGAAGGGPPAPGPELFLVGPEGGFTAAEIHRAEAAGARPLGFPTPVLRTPTAVLLIAALGAWVGEP